MRIHSIPLLPSRAVATALRPTAAVATGEDRSATVPVERPIRAASITVERPTVYRDIRRVTSVGDAKNKAVAAYGYWNAAEEKEHIRETLGFDAYA